jgi:hypothetical protein
VKKNLKRLFQHIGLVKKFENLLPDPGMKAVDSYDNGVSRIHLDEHYLRLFPHE